MLTQLATVKSRLGIDDFDVKNDALLLAAIGAISARFEKECSRIFGRTTDAVHEFAADETELQVQCYPIETVTRFELKTTESQGWVEISGVDFLLRRDCVISLCARLGSWREQARVIYTGGFVSPGDPVGDAQREMPVDLEQAAIEQVAYWYQNRDHLGVIRQWPKGGVYQQFLDLDLLPGVRALLDLYRRSVIG